MFSFKLSKTHILIAISFLFILIISFAISYLFLGKLIFRESKKETTKEIELPKTPTPYFGETQKEEKTKNILLLGYGGKDHSGGFLSDTIILLSLNKEKKTAYLISIPRDIWINLPLDWENLKAAKINEAYAIGIDDIKYPNKKPEFRGKTGGGNMVKYATTQITGLSVDYFVSVYFDQIVKIIDTLGKIRVDVPVSFTDEYYPVKGLENETCGKTPEEMEALKQKYSGFELEKQYKCRYETISFEKGIVEMDGTTALKFMRSRHSATYGGDFSRSQRQMVFLKAIKEKLISLDAFSKVDQIFPELASLVTTDLNLPTAKELISFLGNPEEYQIKEIGLSTENVLTESRGPQGQYILLPKSGFENWQETKNFIKKEMEKEL
ncbi:MAG: Transcriptional regulator [Candidatus Woesebacteria bacterium]|nr:MAG: Transcriptional regulator [Candidatus Woesebacteria bacterium]